MIDFILNAGMRENLPDYLKRRVRPTNIMALILFFVIGLPFIIISLIYVPPLAIVPAVGSLTCVITIIANKLGGIKYSRIALAMMPVALGATYNAFLSNPEQEPVASVLLITLAFSMVVFVVFDLREKKFMIPILIYSAILILSFPLTKTWVNYDVDTAFIRIGWLYNVTVTLGIVTAFGCIYGLSSLNLITENQSEKLIDEMNEKNQKLLNSEENLKENLRLLETAQEEERKRNWATEGLSKVSEILRDSKNDDTIYERLIATTVKYCEANQGALYTMEEEGDQIYLIRQSSYAFGRTKYQDQKIKPGEGLLGQAYLEREYIYMVDIPENYVKIVSGLGDANPSALIIIPLIANDKVEGMLEIASFNKFEKHEIDFLLKMGENVASFIQSNKINSKTKKLLEESIQTSETLKAQEEEMRQNQEELEATQEEMRRQQSELMKMKEQMEDEMNSKNAELATKYEEVHAQLLKERQEKEKYRELLENNQLI